MPRSAFRIIAACLAVALLAAGCAQRVRLAPGISTETPYLLGAGDRLRITVFNQPDLTQTYQVDPSGNVTMPLIGAVQAAGRSTVELKRTIEARLARDFLREPNVSVEIEGYRPFFIFGEVNQGGQYPYVAGMTAEQAIAIAGGFSPRASRDLVQLARRDGDGVVRLMVPLTTVILPGDTVFVKERWF